MALASLLPGLRDLRAPLAAGYVWLVALYIALEPLALPRAQATGVWASVLRLEDVAGTVGFGVAVTFVAYLVGSISEAVAVGIARGSSHWLGWGTLPYHRPGDGRLEQTNRSRARRCVEFIAQKTSSLSPRSSSAVHALAAARLDPIRFELGRLESSLEKLLFLGDGPHEAMGAPIAVGERELGQVIWRMMPEWQQLACEALETPDDAREPVWTRVVSQLGDRLVEQFDLARTNLVGREAEQFSTIDRLRSEAELRSALTLPLGALAAALGWRAGWFASVLIVIAAAALLSQALLRLRQSNDALVELIRLDRAAVPALAQLQMLIDELPRVAERAQQAQEKSGPSAASWQP